MEEQAYGVSINAGGQEGQGDMEALSGPAPEQMPGKGFGWVVTRDWMRMQPCRPAQVLGRACLCGG